MQLKFRAYIDGEFHYFDLKDLADTAIYYFQNEFWGDDVNNFLAWLAEGNRPDVFTGLKDFNGNDIYENDIVDFCGRNQQVIFEEGAFCPIDAEEIKKRQFQICSFSEHENNYSNPIDSISLVGNIHENKDLS